MPLAGLRLTGGYNMTILEALEHIYMGDIYDDKGYLTEKGYLTLQTLEGVELTETGANNEHQENQN